MYWTNYYNYYWYETIFGSEKFVAIGLLAILTWLAYSQNFRRLIFYVAFYDTNLSFQGFMLLSGWAWHVICAPDIFSWNFSFLLLNIGQLVYIVYQMRPVRFDPELEEAYHTLFYPFKVSVPKHSTRLYENLYIYVYYQIYKFIYKNLLLVFAICTMKNWDGWWNKNYTKRSLLVHCFMNWNTFVLAIIL